MTAGTKPLDLQEMMKPGFIASVRISDPEGLKEAIISAHRDMTTREAMERSSGATFYDPDGIRYNVTSFHVIGAYHDIVHERSRDPNSI